MVHCDLKPSNVLLDDAMVAHLGDFGLAKVLHTYSYSSNHSSTSLIGPRGSIGYIAPGEHFSFICMFQFPTLRICFYFPKKENMLL